MTLGFCESSATITPAKRTFIEISRGSKGVEAAIPDNGTYVCQNLK